MVPTDNTGRANAVSLVSALEVHLWSPDLSSVAAAWFGEGGSRGEAMSWVDSVKESGPGMDGSGRPSCLGAVAWPVSASLRFCEEGRVWKRQKDEGLRQGTSGD